MASDFQFFWLRLFDGLWMFEQGINALVILILCHGLVWERGCRLRRCAALVWLSLSIAICNILIFACLPQWIYRIAIMMNLGCHTWLYMRCSGAVNPKDIPVLWCAALGCAACVSALAWQGSFLLAESLNNRELEPVLRACVILGQIPCAMYLRSCDFGEYESVPKGGLLSVVICDLCVIVLTMAESMWVFNNFEVTFIMVVAYSCMLAVSLCIIFAMHRMCREQETIIELQAERQRLLSEQEIMGMVSANIDDLRCLRHELKNQYAYMHIMLQEQRYEELDRYCGALADALPPPVKLANSGNRSIDTVLNMELTRANQVSVPVELELAVPGEMPFAEEDLCAILANLMENAMEECLRLRSRGRDDVSIRMTIQPYGSYLYIVCRNSTDREKLERRQDALRTTKPDERLHGYGTRIINKLAKKYNGTADYKLKDGTFVAKVMLDTMEVYA